MFGTLIHDCAELRTMMKEHPDLPIIVLAGEEASSGEYAWTYCTDVFFRYAKILDVKTPYDDEEGRVFDDMTEFEEAVEEYWYNAEPDYSGMTVEEKVKSEVEKYKPLWRDVIAIYATN